MAKILIVDDDADFIDATANLLRAKGYTVGKRAGWHEGYTKAKAENPDLCCSTS